MSKRYYICDIVGDGSIFGPFGPNPYRPIVANYGVAWVGSIENHTSGPDIGKPKYPDCLVLVSTLNHAQLMNKPGIDPLPDFPGDGKLAGIATVTRTAMNAMLNTRGFDITGLTNTDGYKEALQKIGIQRSATFDIDNFDIAG